MTSARGLPVAALLAVSLLSACDAERPAGLRPAGPLFSNPPSEPFFVAWWRWDEPLSNYPIYTIVSYPNGWRYRQHILLYGRDSEIDALRNTADVAATIPGRLWVNWDEPNTDCQNTPDLFAQWYHRFVYTILEKDPTAKFSPASFAEHGPCYATALDYANAFYEAYRSRYGVPPRVDEWRFNDFGFAWGDVSDGGNGTYDLEAWKARVGSLTQWSVAHGAPMYLGGWSFPNWRTGLSMTQYLSKMQYAMAWVRTHPNIRGAAWWSYKHVDFQHYLANPDGTLRPEGETYFHGPMSVSISGNSAVPAHASCTWTASRSGGVPPFYYDWFVNGVWYRRETSGSFTYYNEGSSFTLRVDATDKYGVVRSSSRTIGVIPSGGYC